MKEKIKELEERNQKLFEWLKETQIENANMRDRLEELGELDDLIEDGSVKDLFTSFRTIERNQINE
jgi:predicted nuclease with TOPRIM domain